MQGVADLKHPRLKPYSSPAATGGAPSSAKAPNPAESRAGEESTVKVLKLAVDCSSPRVARYQDSSPASKPCSSLGKPPRSSPQAQPSTLKELRRSMATGADPALHDTGVPEPEKSVTPRAIAVSLDEGNGEGKAGGGVLPVECGTPKASLPLAKPLEEGRASKSVNRLLRKSKPRDSAELLRRSMEARGCLGLTGSRDLSDCFQQAAGWRPTVTSPLAVDSHRVRESIPTEVQQVRHGIAGPVGNARCTKRVASLTPGSRCAGQGACGRTWFI